MPTAAEVQSAANTLVTEAAKLDRIVNGGPDEVVQTDSGPVKTFSGLQREGEVQINAATDAADAAIAARNTVISVAGIAVEALPKITEQNIDGSEIVVSRDPISNDYLAGNYSGATLVARGVDLAGGCDAVELWLGSADAAARKIKVSMYSRAIAGAVNDGAGAVGDVLLFTETRELDGFVADRRPNRVQINFLSAFEPDASHFYLLLVEVLSATGSPVAFSFVAGRGVFSGSPGYPQINGYFREMADDTWYGFQEGFTAGIRWLRSSRPSAAELHGRVMSVAGQLREINVGAPQGLLADNSATAAPGTWWNEIPIQQAGTADRLHLTATATGWVTFKFGVRDASGTMQTLRSATVEVKSTGNNVFVAGEDFAGFSVESGWFIGVSQATAIVAYSPLGNSFLNATDYQRGVTLAFGAQISVAAPPLVDQRRNRVMLWREELASPVPPVGWDTASGVILYGTGGMTLADGTSRGWGIRVHTHRYVRTDRRVTRIYFKWTAANSRFAVLTAAPSAAQFLDASFSNSGIEVDGAAGKLRTKYFAGIGDGNNGDPLDTAIGDIGFTMVVGNEYVLEWGLNGTVHTATLVDIGTGKRSPKLVAGPVDFSGVDTNEGFQNGSLCFAFVQGNVTITKVEVLHDTQSPSVVAIGDSITKQVFMTASQSWVGQLQAAGVTTLRSAQPGGTGIGGLLAGWREVLGCRPRIVINATGTNDVMLPVSIGTRRWVIQYLIDLARQVGAKTVLTLLHPLPSGDRSAHNSMLKALAAVNEDVELWHWDKALTVNGDGITPDTTLLAEDTFHPIAAGATAQFNRLLVDVPDVMD